MQTQDLVQCTPSHVQQGIHQDACPDEQLVQVQVAETLARKQLVVQAQAGLRGIVGWTQVCSDPTSFLVAGVVYPTLIPTLVCQQRQSAGSGGWCTWHYHLRFPIPASPSPLGAGHRITPEAENREGLAI